MAQNKKPKSKPKPDMSRKSRWIWGPGDITLVESAPEPKPPTKKENTDD